MTSDWIKTTNRFVAFFDIMGFKNLVLKKKHEDIVALLEKLSNSRTLLETVNNRTFSKNSKTMGESKSFTFSDSIIFFTKSNSENDSMKIVFDCIYLLQTALKHNIPIKGAISYGTITVDPAKSIYFGQPIIDAYLLHEDLEMYSVIADNEFEKKIQTLETKYYLKEFFHFYKSPLKSGKINHHILKPLSNNKDEALVHLNNLYNSVSGSPRKYIDNTIDFINTVTY